MSEPLIEPLDPRRCSEQDWERCHALNLAAHAELGTPPTSLRAYRQGHLTLPEGHRRVCWLALSEGAVVAKADLTTATYAPGKAALGLHVAADHRRRGLARALLSRALSAPVARDLETLWAGCAHPAGRAACEYLGGEVALSGAQRFVELADVPWSRVETLCAEGRTRFSGARLVEFDALPEALAGPFLETFNQTWADQPRPEGHPDETATLESRRRDEQRVALSGHAWHTLVSVEPDGSVSGLTDIHHDPADPALVRQYFTGVAPAHRGQGLATWLKAEMLLRLRERYPAAERVVTNNGDENAPMLAINEKLGFGAPIAHATYRFEVDALRARLGIAR